MFLGHFLWTRVIIAFFQICETFPCLTVILKSSDKGIDREEVNFFNKVEIWSGVFETDGSIKKVA